MTRLLTYVSRIMLAGVLLAGLVPSALPAQDSVPAPAMPGVADTVPNLPIEGQQPAAEELEATGFMATADRYMGVVNGWISAVFFADVLFWDPEHEMPLVVLWLIFGATFLTL